MWKGALTVDAIKSSTDSRSIRSDGSFYPVIEIFTSVQGEGFYAGQTTHVLRLAGCNCHCPFCDTPMDDYTLMAPKWIAARLAVLDKDFPTGRLLLTGGEPLVHNLVPLLDTLAGTYDVALESNGLMIEKAVEAAPDLMSRFTWVTVSPKGPIPQEILQKYADEVKYVIPAFEHLINYDPALIISFQPEFGSDAAVKRCFDLLQQYPQARLSVQTHKFIGLR